MFDVFDTLITRSTIDAATVWRRVAGRLNDAGTATIPVDAYVQARKNADTISAEQFDHCATLEEIHRCLVGLLGMPDGDWVVTAKAEMAVEAEVSRPVGAGRTLLLAAREQGLRIVFVSDMHLPSVAIRSLLQGHGCWSEGDELWVSSEARARKRTGELFLQIARTSNVDLRSAVHVGDQPFADRIAPRWVGAVPLVASTAEPNRFERVLLGGAPGDLVERLAGHARELRVRSSDRSDFVHSVAVGVAGPTLVSYALWLLDQVEQRQLKRLYFLSRDGEILRRVTAVLAGGLGLEVDLRYLYGGRMAWRLPSTDVHSDEEWKRFADDILFKHTIVTAPGVALRLGLETAHVVHLAGGATTMLDAAARQRLRSGLDRSQLRQAVGEHRDRQRDLARRYLDQEGVSQMDAGGSAEKLAVVDVGWRGETMRALAGLLAPKRAPLSLFLAWGGSDSLPGGQDAFLWGGQRSDLWGTMPPVATHIEMFCSGSHGPVTGYREVDGMIAPELLGGESIAASHWPVAEMQQSIVEFAELAAGHLHPADPRADLRAVVADLLAEFRERPHLEEARVWGDFPREEDPQGDSVYPIARAFRLRDLATVARPGPFAGRNLAWHQAALARTAPPMRTLMRVVLGGLAIRRRF